MKRYFVVAIAFSIVFLTLITHVSAQVTEFSISKKAVSTVVTPQYTGLAMPAEVELTPDVIGLANGKRLYLLSTAWAFLCETTGDILNEDVLFTPENCELLEKPPIINKFVYIGAEKWPTFFDPSQVTSQHWKRTYAGVLGMHLVNNLDRLYFVQHGENMNLKQYSIPQDRYFYYQNSLNAQPPVTSCFNYPQGGGENTCWEGFYSFAAVGYIPSFSQVGYTGTPVNVGPVVWPHFGYVKDGAISGNNYYHTTSYADDQNLYIYSKSWGYPENATGTKSCQVAARAPLSEAGTPSQWKKYYKGNFSEDAVPSGFTRSAIPSFSKIGAGKESCLFEDDVAAVAEPMYFNVARINGTPYYLGVQERVDPDRVIAIGFRLSSDLVHWSDFVSFERSTGSWGTSRFTYPTLFNKDTTSTDIINGSNFYLVGNQPSDMYKMRKIPLSVNLSCPSLGTPTGFTITYDSPNPGKVILDWGSVTNARTYALKIEDMTDGWEEECKGNDICIEHLKTSSYIFTPVKGIRYQWAVAAASYCDHWSDWGGTAFGSEFMYQLPGDVTMDGQITSDDILEFSKSYGIGSGLADFDNNGVVNILDFVVIYQNIH